MAIKAKRFNFKSKRGIEVAAIVKEPSKISRLENVQFIITLTDRLVCCKYSSANKAFTSIGITVLTEMKA